MLFLFVRRLLLCATAPGLFLAPSAGVAHFLYILRSAGGVLYIGETHDLEWRVERHNDGSACRFTRRHRPVELVYSEVHPDRPVALQRERQLKRWSRAKKEALIAGDRALLKRL